MYTYSHIAKPQPNSTSTPFVFLLLYSFAFFEGKKTCKNPMERPKVTAYRYYKILSNICILKKFIMMFTEPVVNEVARFVDSSHAYFLLLLLHLAQAVHSS